MRAYWSSDPADVSINAICQMAEISKSSLYREFGSEDGLNVAVLEAYAEQVLGDVPKLLGARGDLKVTLNALIDFASADPRMETGCLFYKMQAGKHRLGPKARAKVEEIEAAVAEGFRAFLEQRRDAGDLAAEISVEAGAHYLATQIGLAFTQRAGGASPGLVRRSLTLALSVLERP